MAYDLDAFCNDCRDALKADKGEGGREAVRKNLERLLREKSFLDQHVLAMPPGRHTLYEDPDLGFVVLSHVNTRHQNRHHTITARRGRSMARRPNTPI